MDEELILVLPDNNAENRVLCFFDTLSSSLDSIRQLAERQAALDVNADNSTELKEFYEMGAALFTLIAHSAALMQEERDVLSDVLTFTKPRKERPL